MPFTDPTPGERLGRYELLHQLGVGGMGEVWKAVLHGPQGFRKPVALKLLRRGPSDAAAEAILAREARLGALLNHPNVVGTYDLGVLSDRWYIAMELVEGLPLSELVRDGQRLTAMPLLDVASQACAGLAHIHALQVPGSTTVGLVHRDIKPANLLLDQTGLIKVADLGVARLAGPPDQIAGTPGFMPREQLEGHEDHRADQFALAVTLYQLAVGSLPFGKGHRALVDVGLVETRLRDPSFLQPLDQAAPGLGELVARCLRRDPEQRWGSIAELGAALESLKLRTTGPGLRTWLQAHRGPAIGDPPAPSPVSSSQNTVLVSTAGNLPRPADPFFGRSQQLTEVVAHIQGEGRLLTLLGLGGMGKTRLSIHAARQVARDLPGGAWFVELADTRTLPALCMTVARALDAQLAGRDMVAEVGRILAGLGRAVVILDNLEQVVDAAATAVAEWLQQAPDVTLLCTSRVALQLREEHRFALGALDTRDAEQLFDDRVPRELTPDEQQAVAPLVQALEGMPLALELAAARTRLLSVDAILARTTDRLRLLSGGERDRPERHRSLKASLEGSWELLEPWAAAAMGQLTVFEGGWTLEAAEHVLDLGGLDDNPWTLDVLQALADASLVSCDPKTSRFRMPVVVQQFARTVTSPAALDAAGLRHATRMAGHGGDEALRAPMRSGDPALLARLFDDTDNIVAACRWAARSDQPGLAVLCCRAAALIYQLRGPPIAAIELAGIVLAMTALDEVQRMDLEHMLGHAWITLDRYADAAVPLASALERARALGRPRSQSLILTNLARARHHSGDSETAVEMYREAQQLADQAGETRLGGIASDMLGLALCELGRVDEALDAHRSAVATFRAMGHRRSLGASLGNLGGALQRAAQLEQARAVLLESIECHRSVGHQRSECNGLHKLGKVARDQLLFDEAIQRFARSAELGAQFGNPGMAALATANQAGVVLLRGDLTEAATLLDSLPRDVGPWHQDACVVRAMLLRLQGDPAGAAQVCAGALGPAHSELLRELGCAHMDDGDPAAAEAAWTACLVHARRFGPLELTTRAGARLAALHARSGDLEQASALLVEARAAVDGPLTAPAGMLATMAAEVAHHAGDVAASETLLEQARSWARTMGAGPSSPLCREIIRVGNLREAPTDE